MYIHITLSGFDAQFVSLRNCVKAKLILGEV